MKLKGLGGILFVSGDFAKVVSFFLTKILLEIGRGGEVRSYRCGDYYGVEVVKDGNKAFVGVVGYKGDVIMVVSKTKNRAGRDVSFGFLLIQEGGTIKDADVTLENDAEKLLGLVKLCREKELDDILRRELSSE